MDEKKTPQTWGYDSWLSMVRGDGDRYFKHPWQAKKMIPLIPEEEMTEQLKREIGAYLVETISGYDLVEFKLLRYIPEDLLNKKVLLDVAGSRPVGLKKFPAKLFTQDVVEEISSKYGKYDVKCLYHMPAAAKNESVYATFLKNNPKSFQYMPSETRTVENWERAILQAIESGVKGIDNLVFAMEDKGALDALSLEAKKALVRKDPKYLEALRMRYWSASFQKDESGAYKEEAWELIGAALEYRPKREQDENYVMHFIPLDMFVQLFNGRKADGV